VNTGGAAVKRNTDVLAQGETPAVQPEDYMAGVSALVKLVIASVPFDALSTQT
jgi:hypothetical protein